VAASRASALDKKRPQIVAAFFVGIAIQSQGAQRRALRRAHKPMNEASRNDRVERRLNARKDLVPDRSS
jgi:hypothetical protein